MEILPCQNLTPRLSPLRPGQFVHIPRPQECSAALLCPCSAQDELLPMSQGNCPGMRSQTPALRFPQGATPAWKPQRRSCWSSLCLPALPQSLLATESASSFGAELLAPLPQESPAQPWGSGRTAVFRAEAVPSLPCQGLMAVQEDEGSSVPGVSPHSCQLAAHYRGPSAGWRPYMDSWSMRRREGLEQTQPCSDGAPTPASRDAKTQGKVPRVSSPCFTITLPCGSRPQGTRDLTLHTQAAPCPPKRLFSQARWSLSK